MPTAKPETETPDQPTTAQGPGAPDPTPKTPAEQAESQPTTDNAPTPDMVKPEGDRPGAERGPDEGSSPKDQGPSPEDSSEAASEAPAVDPVPEQPPVPQATARGPVNTNPPPNYPGCFIDIRWQDRPVREAGVNGCQVVDVLRVCYERISHFQAGPFRCLENDKVLTYIQNAIAWDERRTSLRKMQHVEGTNMPHNSTT